MAMRYKIVLLIFTSCLLSSGSFAEEPHKGTSNDKNQQEFTLPEFTLPEITVKGDDSMYSLRKDVLKAEELKFDIFNSLISNKDYKIRCGWQYQLGTRIKHWGCVPGYLEDAGANAAVHTLDRIFQDFSSKTPTDVGQHYWIPSRATMQILLAWKNRALNKAMVALAAEHPELAIAMVRANAMQQFYDAERKKRYKKNILVKYSKQGNKDVMLNEVDLLAAAFLDHSRGVMSDEIWERWDSTYKKLFSRKTYRIFWPSASENKVYPNGFIKYINSIMSDERQ